MWQTVFNLQLLPCLHFNFMTFLHYKRTKLYSVIVSDINRISVKNRHNSICLCLWMLLLYYGLMFQYLWAAVVVVKLYLVLIATWILCFVDIFSDYYLILYQLFRNASYWNGEFRMSTKICYRQSNDAVQIMPRL